MAEKVAKMTLLRLAEGCKEPAQYCQGTAAPVVVQGADMTVTKGPSEAKVVRGPFAGGGVLGLMTKLQLAVVRTSFTQVPETKCLWVRVTAKGKEPTWANLTMPETVKCPPPPSTCKGPLNVAPMAVAEGTN